MPLSVRRPWLVLATMTAFAILAGLAGYTVTEHLSDRETDFSSERSESYTVARELEAGERKRKSRAPNIAAIVSGEQASLRVQRRLRELPQVGGVSPKIARSRDGDSFAVIGWLQRGLPEGPAAAAVARKLERPGVMVGGQGLLGYEMKQQAREDLRRAELIAFPLLLILGLWVFRSVVAAALPVLVGALALTYATGCIRAMSEAFSISLFALNIGMALALGLVVDYALLMVSRFREELAIGSPPGEAAQVTARRAGRTVAFSCAAISASFTSLLVFPIPFIRSVALVGMAVAPIAGATSLLVLPALFSLLGDRVNAIAPAAWQRRVEETARPRSTGAWYRLAQFVMRRPVAVAVAAALFLTVLGLPSQAMRFTGFDITSLPASASARAFAERARDEFRNPGLGEIGLAIHADLKTTKRVSRRVERLARRTELAVASPFGYENSPRFFQMNLNPTHALLSDETKGFVKRLRAMNAPFGVTGDTASYLDTAKTLEERLPYALALLLVATLAFLGAATGSLVLPVKALLMNLLSFAATCGVLVLIFQEGWLEGPLGYESQNALVLALPIVLGAGAFGLLTDYGLFLLMRIKEVREEGLSDREAIALGLERTGRIITAAGILFCAAVGAFATSEVILIKQSAIGISLAVFLDTFLVRPLLVPSLMAILGRWNWWPRQMPASG